MSLFQKSVLAQYIKLQDEKLIEKRFKKFTKYFHNSVIQQNIRDSKEEQYQSGFLTALFVDVFDYKLNPTPEFDLTTEFKNEKGAKKADGAILKDAQAIAVIELKGTKTKDLEKIRQQAFDYKANQSACVYVITSNFEKLRFYIDNAVEHLEFDLFTLTLEEFRLLNLCLSQHNILSDLPKSIKEESLRQEKGITDNLYKDYSVFKRELFRSLVKLNIKNEVFRNELNNIDDEQAKKNIKRTLFKKSQKLIDRLLFIFFAEDRNLLAPNSTLRILEVWNTLNELDAATPLYERFKQYFNYLDTGRKGTDKQAEIYAYNGGLFKPDPILDSLIIDDNLLYDHTHKLSEYDFASQVDVNILGHIFENSLNEIESVNAEIEGVAFDKQKTKRKKDGVFYTPKYITKYIVDNTVGKLCDEKKVEYEIVEEEYLKGKKGRPKAKIETLFNKIENYREWLLTITICDPACGSGAFLNQALDFLIKEHNYLDGLLSSLTGTPLVLTNIETTILENNIYGVDLNEESVEIAKLSLWLRTARPSRKLNNLSRNIKCGNSLIDDPKIAGNKVFNWHNEFPGIFENGGFDVVIGNPPYGAKFNNKEIEYYNKTFKHQSYQLDSYLLFTEKLKDWLKNNGFAGYIMPNTWLSLLFGSNIRRFVLNNFELLHLVHYDYFVFEDATVETDTYILKNTIPNKHSAIELINIDKKSNEDKSQLIQNYWIELNGEPINIYQSMEASAIKFRLSKLQKLGDVAQIVQGSKPFQKGKGSPKQTEETMKLKPFVSDIKKDESFVPLLRGSLMNKYVIYWQEDYWISYGNWLAEPRYSANFACEEKLIIRQTGDSLIATYDNEQFIVRDNLYVIRDDNKLFDLKGLLAVINSKFFNWYFQNILNPERGKAMAQVKRGHLQLLPIINSRFDQLRPFTDQILSMNSILLNTINNFIKFLKSQFTNIELTKKLQNWHTLDFGEFIKELNKSIIKGGGAKLSKMDEMDWMEIFETKKTEAQTLKAQIDKTDAKIDALVYELYGLTKEEIAIVEEKI